MEDKAGIGEAYTAFAGVYDTFMDNVPYDEWADYLTGILKDYGIQDGLMLDLGCGTGRMTRILRDRGFDMIGVDDSEDMLAIAREHSPGDILYLQQDMREFELYGTVRSVVSVCDCMNYILEPDELEHIFALVNNYLDPGGVFVFDMNTIHKYRDVIGEQTIAEDREDCSFIWDNYYDEDERINEYDLTFFVKERGELFRRYREVHCQRAYEVQKVCQLLESAGLKTEAVYNAFTREKPGEDSERVCFVARECAKTLKLQEKNKTF